jgi:glutamate-1-semialdehyde 2,1-aminomutase
MSFLSESREASVRAKTKQSLERYNRALKTLAGGVSTALRRNAKPYPLYFDHGAGSCMFDVDGNEYIDYGLAWGPLILGHAHPAVVTAVSEAAAKGMTFGAQHDLEYEVSEMLVKIIPCADLVAYSNSGTEIVQVALRLARSLTKRQRYLRFDGHYHGWIPHDGSVICDWNSVEQVEAALAAGDIAAIIAEPLLANGGCIPADPGFLEFLREVSTKHGALLIFDEVITGFRLALGGAQERFGVTPDLATYAKAVGAGAPLSVLAGRREFMNAIATGDVMHAGTLNGNPVSLAAAKAALEELSKPGTYETLRSRAERLRSGLQGELGSITSGDGPVFTVSFMDQPARMFKDRSKADAARYADLAMGLLDEGVLVLPDGRWYVSTAHSDADIDATLARVRAVVTAEETVGSLPETPAR